MVILTNFKPSDVLSKVKIRHVDSSAKGDDSLSLRSIVLTLIPWQKDIVVAGDLVVDLP